MNRRSWIWVAVILLIIVVVAYSLGFYGNRSPNGQPSPHAIDQSK